MNRINKQEEWNQSTASIYYSAMEATDCTKDEGEIRTEFKRRPHLYLLAGIVRGLFSISHELYLLRKRGEERC